MLLEACIQLFQPRQHDLNAMRNFLLGLSLLLVFSTAPALSEPTDQQADFQQIQLHLNNLDSAKNQHETEIQQIKQQIQNQQNQATISQQVTDKRFEMQDARVGDLGIATGQQANAIALLGIFITFIALVAGFGAYFTAANRAAQEAEKHAESASEKWFETHGLELKNKINDLKKLASSLEKDSNNFQEMLRNEEQRILNVKEQNVSVKITHESISAVSTASQALNAKPENNFSAEDHHIRGLDEFQSDRYDSALISFTKAVEQSEAENSSPQSKIKYLFALATSFGALKKHKEAIEIYNKIDKNFSTFNDKEISLTVLISLYNKAHELGDLNNLEEQNKIYNEIFSRFSSDPSPIFRLWTAKSIFNQTQVLIDLKLYNEALKVCNRLITEYGYNTESEIREVVAKAIVRKSIILFHLSKNTDSLLPLEYIENLFNLDSNYSLEKYLVMALVTKAYLQNELKLVEDAISTSDKLIKLYSENTDPEIQEHVARAKKLLNKLRDGSDEATPPA